MKIIGGISAQVLAAKIAVELGCKVSLIDVLSNIPKSVGRYSDR